MTDGNRFFKFVWRVNALAIFCVALLAGLLCLYALYSIFQDKTRDRGVTDLLVVNPEQKVQEEVILGYPSAIAGTSMVRVPLYREQKTELRYYSKSSSANIVNELFVNGLTGESVWLFKGAQRLILNSVNILQKLKSETPVVSSIVYTLVDKDTDANGRLTASDHITVGFSNLQGTSYSPLLDQIDKLFALEQVADDRLIMLYAKNGESRMTTYSLPTFSVITDSALPKLDEIK
jgi:hypothetical protein